MWQRERCGIDILQPVRGEALRAGKLYFRNIQTVYDFVADHSFRLIWGPKRKTPRRLIYLNNVIDFYLENV
jgi:hypothetical protein